MSQDTTMNKQPADKLALESSEPNLGLSSDALGLDQPEIDTGVAPNFSDTEYDEPRTLGAVLQHMRKQSGLDTASLAAILKVSERKIDALESDRLEELPDLVFARGLVSSICRLYKVDAQPVLGLMPKAHIEKETVVPRSVGASLKSSPRDSWGILSSMFSSKSLLLAMVLLAAAIVVIFLPKMSRQDVDFATQVSQTQPASATPEVANTTSPGVVSGSNAPSETAGANSNIASAESANSENAKATDIGTAIPTSVVGNTSTGSAASPSPASASSSAALVAAAASSSGAIVFQASDDSWVSVRQVNEQGKSIKTIFNSMVKAGAPVSVDVQPPYAVTVGRADVMKVQIAGKDYDLTPLSKGNQARFTIKQ